MRGGGPLGCELVVLEVGFEGVQAAQKTFHTCCVELHFDWYNCCRSAACAVDETSAITQVLL